MEGLGYSDVATYHCFTPEDLPEGLVDDVYVAVEKILMKEQKNVVFDLIHIDSIFSQHLTMFLKVYKLLESFKLQFILVGISPAVLNVIQMTQLDGYLKLFMSREEYEGRLQETEKPSRELSFSYTVKSQDDDTQVVSFNGFVTHCTNFKTCINELKASQIIFDFEGVGFVDAESLIAIASLNQQHTVYIKNPSKAIVELLEEKDVLDQFLIEE